MIPNSVLWTEETTTKKIIYTKAIKFMLAPIKQETVKLTKKTFNSAITKTEDKQQQIHRLKQGVVS
jgi:ABC-type amino acid transport system permease subunit